MFLGSMSFLCLIFGFLCVPELKGRSLEEVEVMFEEWTPLRKFGQYQAATEGIGAAVTRLERAHSDGSTTSKYSAGVTHSDSSTGSERPLIKSNGT